MPYVELRDEETTYALIKVEDAFIPKIKELLNKFRKETDDYNIDDFLALLEDKHIPFEQVQTEPDIVLYF